MFQDELGAIFIWENLHDLIVWLMLHDDASIFNMVKLKIREVVKENQEYLSHEELFDTPFSFQRENSRLITFPWLLFDLVQIDLAFVRKNGNMGLVYFNLFYCKLAVNFSHLLNICKNSPISSPSKKSYCICYPCCYMARAQCDGCWFKWEIKLFQYLPFLLGRTVHKYNLREWT